MTINHTPPASKLSCRRLRRAAGVVGSLVPLGFLGQRVWAGSHQVALLAELTNPAICPAAAAIFVPMRRRRNPISLRRCGRSRTQDHHSTGPDLTREIALYAEELKRIEVIKRGSDTGCALQRASLLTGWHCDRTPRRAVAAQPIKRSSGNTRKPGGRRRSPCSNRRGFRHHQREGGRLDPGPPAGSEKLVATILQQRGENLALAQYWQGYGLREHVLYTDRDAQFWIDVLVRGGKLKPGQLTPEDVETNRYNELAHLAQQ
jgi:hypothetical protein